MRKDISETTLNISPQPVWFKVTGMLQQNWAVIHPLESKGVVVYFFDDHSNIFDQLNFLLYESAELALTFNQFTRLSADLEFRKIAVEPTFPLYISYRHRPVYSSGEYWEIPGHAHRPYFGQQRPQTPG